MTSYTIPLNRAAMGEAEQGALREALAAGQISGDGPFTRKCHEVLQRTLGVPRVLLTTSCTHALEMAALLLDIKPGDEVIVPSFTFVSTINAFVLRGAIPLFCDIRPDTLNLDEALLEPLITPRTRAILVVHYAGVACEMDPILDIAQRHGIPVVEDNAHGLFGRYRGRLLGTFTPLGALSFHETKNFSCGEGGALLINDPGFGTRAEILREKGTDRSRFWRGEIDKYSWVDIGSSYLPSDILAACLWAQLERRGEILAARRRIWERYAAELAPWASRTGIDLPCVPSHCEQAYHMFYLRLPSIAHRESLRHHLGQRGILAAFHYVPLHLSAMGLRLGWKPGDCPVTEHVSETLLRLPFFTTLTEPEHRAVLEAVQAWHPD